MAEVNLTDWVPVDTGSEVWTRYSWRSAVERFARPEPMTTDIQEILVGHQFDVVGEDKYSGTLHRSNNAANKVLLHSRKWRSGEDLATEDLEDANPDVVNQRIQDWLDSYAIVLDNAALGTTAASNGTTVMYDSVYKVATDNGLVTQTAGPVTYDIVSDALGEYEDSGYFDDPATVVMASPAFRRAFRNVKDTTGAPVFVQGVAGTPETLFGYPVVWTPGAKTSAVNTSNPTGNPLLVFANSRFLVRGDRYQPQFRLDYDKETDAQTLQGRARKGFVVAEPTAVSVVEITAGP